MSDVTPYATLRATLINEDSFINEIINDEKGRSSEIFSEDFGYQNPSFLAKDLTKIDQYKINKQLDKLLIQLMS